MISVRYHFITIAAVFLALGIGILLGGMAGQSWLSDTERELLKELEAKYDQALRSNSELKQQLNKLTKQVERDKEAVIQLMAAYYAADLQGAELYVWQAEREPFEQARRLLTSVGVQLLPYQPDGNGAAIPLILFARELPDWSAKLPLEVKRLHVPHPPDTPEEQWRLLEDVRALLREARWEREKS